MLYRCAEICHHLGHGARALLARNKLKRPREWKTGLKQSGQLTGQDGDIARLDLLGAAQAQRQPAAGTAATAIGPLVQLLQLDALPRKQRNRLPAVGCLDSARARLAATRTFVLKRRH